VNIYYRERLSPRRLLQRSRSRVSYLEGNSDVRGGFKDEEGESEPEERFYYRIAWGVDARTHTPRRGFVRRTIVRRTAVLYGEAVSGRHNPNSKPVPAPWVNNNILLHPALSPYKTTSSHPSLDPAPTICTSHATSIESNA